MNLLHEKITRYRKMAIDDPEDELAHYRLGEALLDDKQYAEAISSFSRALEMYANFSKARLDLAQSLLGAGQRQEAIQTLHQGCTLADQHGHDLVHNEMARMLTELGEPAPMLKAIDPVELVHSDAGDCRADDVS